MPERTIAERDAQTMPPIDASVLVRWRSMLSTLAETMGMCDGRIWSLSGTEAEVIIGHGSPLPGEGMRVAVKGSKLLYQNVALERSTLDVASPQWSGSSEAAQGLKDYLGLPISWPNGTLFGVIEVLTAEPRPFTSLHRRLATQVRDNIEDHLGGITALAEQTRVAEERRLEREVRQLAAATVDFGAWDYDIAAGKLDGDAGWHHVLGLDNADPVTTLAAFKRLIHIDDLAEVTDANLLGLGEPDADGEGISIVFRVVRPDGQTRWIRSSARVMDGTPRRSVGVIVDITDNHVTENALHQGRAALIEAESVLRDIRERLHLAAEASGLGIWEYNVDAGTLHCDASLSAMLGVEPGDLADAKAFNSRVHSQDRTLVNFKALAKGKQASENQDLQFRIVRPSGEIRWLSCTTHMSQATATLPKRLRGFVTDVTEAHLAREETERNKAALKQTEQLVRLANWRFDRATQQFFASAMLNTMNDSAPAAEPLTQADMEQLLSPQSQDGATNAIQHCLKTGKPYAIEVQYTRPDGSSFPASVRGRAERDAKGAIIGVTGTVQDLSEREEAGARIAALADALPLGAIYCFEVNDGHFALTSASAGIEALVGLSEDALLADGEAFLGAITEPDRTLYLAELERALHRGEVFDCRFRVNRSEGAIIWLHSRAVPRLRPDGSTVWEAILWDITNERQATETLRQAGDALAVKGRAQNELLATMSRDIRTPMNAVIGMTRLALQTELAPKQRSYLDKIDSATKGLQSIITDVVDYSKVEAGRLELDNAEFTLESLLDAVSTATASRADEKGLEIAYAIGAGVPRGMVGDQRRLAQVLINLVGNAIKCTEAGEILLSIDRLPADDGSPVLEFRVRDTGVALDEAQIDGLFRPFAPTDSHTSPRYGGSGLTLAICKRLVEQMGGAIAVDSQPGRDTVFSFTMALPQAEAAEEIPTNAFGNRQVLIVDDNASARTILSDLLSGLGMAPQIATSGIDALAALHRAVQKSKPFDLVLMDWRMPGMDGLELARRIRADEALNRMPTLLMVTAHGREDIRRRVDQLGLQGLLIKPATQASMFAAMQTIFAIGKGNLKLAEDDRAPDQTMALLAERRVLVVEGDALTRDAITDFLEVAGMTVDTAATGSEALERLARRAYDAVLMDMQMPGMDGRDTTRRIRRNPAWARLPVIAMTMQDGLADRDAGPGAGMTARLAKPVDAAGLYRGLADVFIGTEPVESISPPDFDVALRRQNGDPERLARLLRGFLRDFADIPAKLGNLIGTDDMPEAGALAHLVKGAAGSLEARQLVAAAGELEQAARDGDRDIDAVAREFRRQLLAALDAVSARLAQDSRLASMAVDTDRQTTLALIARVEPLAARGDRAASTALKQLATLLEGQAQTR